MRSIFMGLLISIFTLSTFAFYFDFRRPFFETACIKYQHYPIVATELILDILAKRKMTLSVNKT